MLVKALTIAGSDSGGGAGIQADLKTFEALGVYGCSVLTAVTAQNTQGVAVVKFLSPALVEKQIDAVISDLRPEAVKTGMLGSAGIVQTVARKLEEYGIKKLVVDPVMVATAGGRLLDRRGFSVLKTKLLPLALVVTPNLDEAAALAGFAVKSFDEMKAAARRIRSLGPRSVVITGGHRSSDANDLLYAGGKMIKLSSPVRFRQKLHGAGCTFSAAIAAGLAQGKELETAVKMAKAFMIGGLKYPLHPGEGAYTVNWRAPALQ